jgi:hypothetical protein
MHQRIVAGGVDVDTVQHRGRLAGDGDFDHCPPQPLGRGREIGKAPHQQREERPYNRIDGHVPVRPGNDAVERLDEARTQEIGWVGRKLPADRG